MSTREEAWEVVQEASECDDHPCNVPFVPQDIETVLYYTAHCDCKAEGYCASYCDTEAVTVFQLSNGKYVRAWANADSSGHG